MLNPDYRRQASWLVLCPLDIGRVIGEEGTLN